MALSKEDFVRILTEEGLKEETANKLYANRPEEFDDFTEEEIRSTAKSFHGNDELATTKITTMEEFADTLGKLLEGLLQMEKEPNNKLN